MRTAPRVPEMNLFTCASGLSSGTLALLVISACATYNEFRPTGANSADGVVQLSYDYVLSDRPVLDWVNAQDMAEERCTGWGYDGAQRSGTARQYCLTTDIFGRCKSFQVNVNYHCTDAYAPN